MFSVEGAFSVGQKIRAKFECVDLSLLFLCGVLYLVNELFSQGGIVRPKQVHPVRCMNLGRMCVGVRLSECARE